MDYDRGSEEMNETFFFDGTWPTSCSYSRQGLEQKPMDISGFTNKKVKVFINTLPFALELLAMPISLPHHEFNKSKMER